jgi:hypothetical protein
MRVGCFEKRKQSRMASTETDKTSRTVDVEMPTIELLSRVTSRENGIVQETQKPNNLFLANCLEPQRQAQMPTPISPLALTTCSPRRLLSCSNSAISS